MWQMQQCVPVDGCHTLGTASVRMKTRLRLVISLTRICRIGMTPSCEEVYSRSNCGAESQKDNGQSRSRC